MHELMVFGCDYLFQGSILFDSCSSLTRDLGATFRERHLIYPSSTRYLHSVSTQVSSHLLLRIHPVSRSTPPLRRSSFSGDTSQKHVADAAIRNLGLHYLSEGRVDDACLFLRTCLETLEKTLRPDMAGGDESLDLIPPLTVLSYAEMLAGAQ